MFTLYDFEMSGNCYKVRLLLKMLNIPHRLHAMDFYPGRGHKSAWFLKLNPLGQLPVLQRDDFVLHDSQAILVYLASHFDPSGAWYPRARPEQLVSMSAWLAFADKLSAALSTARAHEAMFEDGDVTACRTQAQVSFRMLDQHLWFSERSAGGWILDGEHPTIADIACFPFVALSDEAGVSRRDCAALRRWCDRVRGLPDFMPMSGILAMPSVEPASLAVASPYQNL